MLETASAAALQLLVDLSFRPSKRRRRQPVPLGPIPALHSLVVTLASAVIFLGILLSALAEIRDTRWSWRRTRRTPVQWLLCFPLGTRPSGRVFFWSYAFYLSRWLHLGRTFLEILRGRGLSPFRLLNQSMLLCMSFLWLEFSQSFQVLAILLTTLLHCVVYGYRFWTAVGLRGACFPLVENCQVVALGCNLVCHFAVLFLHLLNGGCNGIGAWVFNSVLNGAILMLVLRFYVHLQRKDKDNRVGSPGPGADPGMDKDL
ncbi:hypothetical protein MLD38_034922 [Melastoma candidum]|uniref:Uncharacterized protein n=1 Tax=Melastoma candidum TaxID=119954 RepID=A0ACB9MCV0_9MYRT|nr:hypothetical protein MLD38_034922 [Melastoma candidum]